MPTELLDAQQVADQLHCKKTTVWIYAKQGKIDVIIIGRQKWFTQEAVNKFILTHTFTTEEADRIRNREIADNTIKE